MRIFFVAHLLSHAEAPLPLQKSLQCGLEHHDCRHSSSTGDPIQMPLLTGPRHSGVWRGRRGRRQRGLGASRGRPGLRAAGLRRRCGLGQQLLNAGGDGEGHAGVLVRDGRHDHVGDLGSPPVLHDDAFVIQLAPRDGANELGRATESHVVSHLLPARRTVEALVMRQSLLQVRTYSPLSGCSMWTSTVEGPPTSVMVLPEGSPRHW